VGIGLRDPRSQKRDLGHPSVSPFDIADGTRFVVSLPTRLSEAPARDDRFVDRQMLPVATCLRRGPSSAVPTSLRDDGLVQGRVRCGT
jgi:hypothetical protein